MFLDRAEQPLVNNEENSRPLAYRVLCLVHGELGFYYFNSVLLCMKKDFFFGFRRNVAGQNNAAPGFFPHFVHSRVKADDQFSRAPAQAKRL